MSDTPAVQAAVDKAINKTFWRDYPAKPEYQTLTDVELAAIKRRFPKYANEMSEEQKAQAAGVYREELRRYYTKHLSEIGDLAAQYAEFSKSGKWPDGEPFPEAGTPVSNVVGGLFGLPQVVEGVVKKKKDGTYVVSVTSKNVGGARTTPLTRGWKPKARLSR